MKQDHNRANERRYLKVLERNHIKEELQELSGVTLGRFGIPHVKQTFKAKRVK